MNLRIFGWSYAVTVVALVVAFFYGNATGRGLEVLILCAILGILEISLSFDNAVVNATVLERMSPFWQRIFLTACLESTYERILICLDRTSGKVLWQKNVLTAALEGKASGRNVVKLKRERK